MPSEQHIVSSVYNLERLNAGREPCQARGRETERMETRMGEKGRQQGRKLRRGGIEWVAERKQRKRRETSLCSRGVLSVLSLLFEAVASLPKPGNKLCLARAAKIVNTLARAKNTNATSHLGRPGL